MDWSALAVAVLLVSVAATFFMVGKRIGSLASGWRLANAEASAAAILDAAVDGIITIDSKGNVASLNRAAERIFGYRAEEVIGRNVSMLMPEPYHGSHDEYLRNYLATGRAKIIGIGREVEGRRKDGSTFPMDLAVGESRSRGRRLFAGIVRDITDRKLVESELRASEERFRVLVDSVRDYAITMLAPDGTISSWNLGAERLYGWRADEVLGSSFSRFYPPDDIATGKHERGMALARAEGRSEEEGWRVRKDGSRFWAHVVVTAVYDERGRVKGFARISQDMTEHKAHEDRLRRAKEEAERARESAERLREVAERARADAERADAAKTRFLAAASHDLRQPVQAILFFTSVLSDKLADHPARSVLDDLNTSLAALNMLLESLLDVSRLDAGLVMPKETDFGIGAVLDRVASEFGPMAREKGLELRVVGSSAIVHSDPALLARIVQNLVANAVRYTKKGRILVGCRRRGRSLEIAVLDTGVGIPAGRTREIFEEFVQLGNPERDRTQGLGLGLAIVSRLARLLGTRIQVRSQLGRGSCFSVEIPIGHLMLPSTMLVTRLPEAAYLADGNRLVMVIDDEAIVLKGMSMLLQSWGYDVIAAASEDEAIEKLRALGRPLGAILADYRLREGHTGTEAVRRIRDLCAAPIPGAIITGDTAPERLREAEASGLSVLHKPIQPPALRDILEGMFKRLGHTLH